MCTCNCIIINNINKIIIIICRAVAAMEGTPYVIKGCSCARKNIPCSDCYPCRRGKCRNLITLPEHLSSISTLPPPSPSSIASSGDDLPPDSASPRLLSDPSSLSSHSQQLSAWPSAHSQQLSAVPMSSRPP